MSRLYLFNPEHDLCLANGGAHYVAPEGALRIAGQHADVMRYLYGDDVCAVTAAEVAEVLTRRPFSDDAPTIVPWGWDAALRQRIAACGVAETTLPDMAYLAQLRRLQHRATLLPLQPESRLVTKVEEVDMMLRSRPQMVLKAPWSGSGRGIRWVKERMSQQDRMWMQRVVNQQQGVIAEPRREVQLELALEYEVRRHGDGGALFFRGLSLFESRQGVYRGNWFIDDDAIVQRVAGLTDALPATRTVVEGWLRRTVAPHYRGPLGVDLYVDGKRRLHVSELNLRHTMGMVAHTLLQRHPAWAGCFGSPLALHRAVLSIGSNMGNRAALLRGAVHALSERVGPVVRRSPVVETAPWGFSAERNFLNQVVVVDTALSAEQVLQSALAIEATMGRRRDYDPLHPPESHVYQSRPIDIDIIFFDDTTMDTPLLQIPHPRMHLRRFVLEPLCALMPGYEHPALHRTVRQMLDDLNE